MLILTILLINHSFQNTETHSIDSSIIWTIKTTEHHRKPSIEKYKIDGDTVINGKEYYKLFSSRNISRKPNNWHYECALRDSSGVLYFMPKWDYWTGNHPEYLLYNFNVQIGDTVDINNFWTSKKTYRIVNSIDSVEIAGTLRKRIGIGLFEDDISEYWIEGIGSNYGLLYSGNYQIIRQYKLVSVEIKNSLLHLFDLNEINESYFNEEFSVSNDGLQYKIQMIHWNFNKQAIFELYKSNGKLLYKSDFTHGFIFIPKIIVEPGEYIFRLNFELKGEEVGKIIIN